MSNSRSQWFHFESYIYGEQKKIFNPNKIVFENISLIDQPNASFKPLKYQADALVSIAALKLMENKSSWSHEWYNKIHTLWEKMDPHFGVYHKIHPQVATLVSPKNTNHQSGINKLDQAINNIVDEAVQVDCVHFHNLLELVDAIYHFEQKCGHPILYDFKTQLSSDTRDKLLTLYSLLFHLRSLVAADYNSHTNDASIEAVKVDPITDYLPKAEYIANDAALYFKFLKLSHQLQSDKNYPKMEKQFVDPMIAHFKNYSHNGFCLVEGLPPKFIDKLPDQQIEDFLYLVQMDWILGSDTGLLYRIREEIFGLVDGYDQIFWPECQGDITQPTSKLHLQCEIEAPRIHYGPKAA